MRTKVVNLLDFTYPLDRILNGHLGSDSLDSSTIFCSNAVEGEHYIRVKLGSDGKEITQ